MAYAGLDNRGGRTVQGVAHLQQSIADILGTPLGSRLERREYGSLLPELIDQPDNATTRIRLYAASAAALMRWEPRLRLTRVAVVSLSRPGQIVLDIEGTHSISGADLSLRVPLGLGGTA